MDICVQQMAVCLPIYNPIMEDKIREYLKEPSLQPRPPGDQDPLFQFLIAYIGQLFVQGYRIIENYGDILLLSLMEFQYSESSMKTSRHLKKLPPRFKVLLWQMTSKDLFQIGKYRRQYFTKMLEIGKMLQEVEYHIIYLKEVRYSIIPEVRLEKNSLPTCLQYFLKIQWIEQKNGCRPIMEKDQGIEMHKLVESFIKGAGEGRNPDLIRRIQGQNKFVYDLFKVINTVCYIIGKQILENDYQTISVQKWMRKFTQKKFKRYDLLMRGEHKCSIIDWKFTRLDAEDKIRGASTHKKNIAYYQLAKKDFKTDIQLKFYCFHQRAVNLSYHSFSSAKFNYQISTVHIDDQDRRVKGQEKDESDFRFAQISIEDSVVDLVPDTPGDEIVVRQRPVISIDSEQEVCVDQRSSSNSSLSYRNSRINRPTTFVNQQTLVQIKKILPTLSEEIVITNKQKIKTQKRMLKQKENLIAALGKAQEIDSD